ncbi:MAG: FtsB family cell division protein [Sphingobacteriaceae bacterium]
MNQFIQIIKNKYFLGSLAFVIWMLFFDRNDLFSQYEYRQQVNKLKAEKDFYAKETKQVEKDILELSTQPATLEKFAREKYLMKKPNEDIFVIIPEEKGKEKSFFSF